MWVYKAKSTFERQHYRAMSVRHSDCDQTEHLVALETRQRSNPVDDMAILPVAFFIFAFPFFNPGIDPLPRCSIAIIVACVIASNKNVGGKIYPIRPEGVPDLHCRSTVKATTKPSCSFKQGTDILVQRRIQEMECHRIMKTFRRDACTSSSGSGDEMSKLHREISKH